MNTITDDEIDAVAHAAWGSRYHPQGQRAFARAVLALAESKSAAKVAELEAAERQRNAFAQQANEYAEEARALRARIAELEAQAAQPAQVPDILFDGYAVLRALTERAKLRTSAENVNDVLDTVVRLMRTAPKSAQVAAPDDYLGGVNLARLQSALTNLGCATVGQEETAARLGEFVNRLADAVLRNMDALRGAKVAAPTQADGWVMLDKRGLVHQERWWKCDFFGGIETREGFTPADVDNACREWPGLAPFTVVPVFLAAAPKREGGA